MTNAAALALFLLMGLILGYFLGWNRRAQTDSPGQSAELVRSQLTPLEKAMAQLTGHMREMEIERAESLGQLSAQIQAMSRTSLMLTDRTDKLVTALRAPQVRGRWGEMQLERVVELSGMVKHCDFDTQVSHGSIRPDMVVRLSDGRNIVVDAKAPFLAYLDALDTTDPEEHEAHLRRHAHHLRQHVTQLSTKDYQKSFPESPEFVVLFVPADPFLDAALRIDNELLEFAFSKNVVLATPTTLIALLRTVGLGWQHNSLSEKASEIQRLGSELYQRLGTVSEHMNRLGSSLDKAVTSFNSTIASLDSRVFVTARKLDDLDALPHGRSSVVPVSPIDTRPRIPRYQSEGSDISGT
ncbi:DNA recombination protein RmuC [Corynebacterium sp. H130]|uniref:DNA recombination protein RmuC n=1 Tax=Corynebacterium sp. H130 TaxID=3133444 RepID=UPI0030986C3D